MAAVFLHDQDKNELKYRLGLRAALLLSDDPPVRRSVYRTIRRAYDFGSTAIHTGRLSGKAAKGAARCLEDAADLVFRGTITLLQRDRIDWEELTLGVVPDE